MFMHFAIILKIYKDKKTNFPQVEYDNLFKCIENNLRKHDIGDNTENKKMKDLNKIF